MTADEILKLASSILDDMKGRDIISLDIRTMTPMTDFMIICSGSSSRHLQSMANELAMRAKAKRIHPIHVEGKGEHEWILVDLGDVIVHLMTPEMRTFYDLEKLWEPLKELRQQP